MSRSRTPRDAARDDRDPGVEVREAVAEDAASIGAFLHAIWDEAGPDAPGFAGATPELIDELARPDAVRERLGGPARRMVIAVHEGEVVGFAATRQRSTRAVELAGIMVRRAWAGRGVGKELVREAIEVLQRNGATSVAVRTEVDNTVAVGFYEALGFERIKLDVESVGEIDVDVVELVREI